MKKLIILLLVALLATNISYSQNEKEIEDLKRKIQMVSDSQKEILNEFTKLRKNSKYQNTLNSATL